MDAAGLAKPWVGRLKPYVPGETHEGCIKLASNENNYGPSPKAVEAIREAAAQAYKYPYKDRLLREKIADYAGVSPDNIVCGNGSDELIELTLKAFRGPAAGVTPSFSEYKIISRTLGLEYSETRLGEGFVFDVGDFIEGSKDANVVFLDNPDNPTGGVIAREDIERILGEGKITVIDEAYFEFYKKTVADLTSEFPNLIVLRTFSKAFGLGGLRVGYAIAASETIKLLDRVRPPFNVNSIAQEAALAALDDTAYMQDCVKKIVADRKKYGKTLAEKIRVLPSQANFWLTDVAPMTAKEFFKRMLEQKIVVRCFGPFPGFGGEYVRITVGKTEENEKLIDALKNIP